MLLERPSSQMLACLRLTAQTGQLVALGGGYWVSGAAGESQREDLVRGQNRDNWPDFVGTRTVYACEARGWIRRAHVLNAEHRDARSLTEAGRHILEREERLARARESSL
jgi:hypothetical protein